MATYRCDPRPLVVRMLALVTSPVAWATGPFFLSRSLSVEAIQVWALAGVALCLGLGVAGLAGFRGDGVELQRDLLERRVLRRRPRSSGARSVPADVEIINLFALFKGFMLVLALLVIYFLSVFVDPRSLEENGRLGLALLSGLGRFSLVLWLYTWASMQACNSYSWLIVQATYIVPQGASLQGLVPRWAAAQLRIEACVLALDLLVLWHASTTLQGIVGTTSALLLANVGYFWVYHHFLRCAYKKLSGSFDKRWLAKKP